MSAIKTPTLSQKQSSKPFKQKAITHMLRLKIFKQIEEEGTQTYAQIKYAFARVSGYVLRQHLSILIRSKHISYDQ